MPATSSAQDDLEVLLVEPYALVANALCASLRSQGVRATTIQGCDERGDIASLLESMSPRAIVIDIDPVHEARCGHSRLLESASSLVPTIVLTSVDANADVAAWLRAGATAVVNKGSLLSDLVTTLREVVSGHVPPGDRPGVRMAALATKPKRAKPAPLDRLTPTEREVLGSLLQGRTVREVAEERVVAETTVRSHVRSILAKLGVHSQIAAIAMAHEAGFAV